MKHLLTTIGCSFLNDERRIFNLLLEACYASGCSVIGNVQHSFYPIGFSALILIGESHVSIHTWPEQDTARIDFFSCNPEPKFDRFLNVFSSNGCTIYSSIIVDRTEVSNTHLVNL